LVRRNIIKKFNLDKEEEVLLKALVMAFMRSYAVGAESASKELDLKTFRLKPRPEDLKMYKAYSLKLSGELSKEVLDEVKRIINLGIRQKLHPDEIMKNIQDRFRFAPHRARTIARSETARASYMGKMAVFKDEKVKWVEFVAGGGPRMCPECGDLDARVFELAMAPAIPIHCSCRCTYVPAVR